MPDIDKTIAEIDAELARLAQTLACGAAFIAAMNGEQHEPD